MNLYLSIYNQIIKIMNLFFSPPVRAYSLILQHHQAPTVIDKLVSTGFVEFQMNPYDDSNDPFYMVFSRVRQLKFKILALIQTIQEKYGENVPSLTAAERQLSIGRMKDYIDEKQIDFIKYLDMEESVVLQKLDRFWNMANNYDNIINNIQTIDEQLDLVKAKMEIGSRELASNEFVILTGTCFRKDRYIIERLLFRKTHGHSYIIFKDRNSQTQRDLFLCFVSKGVYKNVSGKLKTLFDLNKAVLYELPNLQEHLANYAQTLQKKLKDHTHLLQISDQQFTKSLKQNLTVPESSFQYHLARITYLERIIYIICHSKPVGSPANHHVFTIHVPQNEVIPQLPVPLIPVQDKHKPRTIMPRLPCLFQVNILTQLYSVPKYNEILPSIFMFATVPILFGMMFSDIGHGLMLLAIAYFFNLGSLFYMMAFMSCYCGLIYNQFFGMKIVLTSHLGIIKGEWGIAQNGINFQNSLKMKLSMVIAFVHMVFGTVLKIVNQIKRGQTKSLYLDSLPKLVLMFTTIGYLVFLIVAKWLTNYDGRTHEAPSIINTMLQLFLGFKEGRKISILGSVQREKQIGSFLNTISFLCILIMVYNHTIRHRFQEYFFKTTTGKRKNRSANYQQLEDQDIDEQINMELASSQEDFQKNQLNKSITYYYQKQEHQSQLGALEVFEYILSLISSTTSYLRLFALSLAHGKLSHLLLQFLLSTLSSQQPTISILRCWVFFTTTIGMMLMLDVMECLMHVVRLHWVEWMGKFYTGTGVLFKPQIAIDFN